MKNKLLEAALKYNELGYSVIPIKPDKKSFIKWKSYQTKRADEKQIRSWWEKFPSANIAIITGEISGTTVIDVDSPEGHAAINEYLPETFVAPTVNTPDNLYHLHFKHVPGIKNKARLLTGTDARNDGGYALVPPSITNYIEDGIGKGGLYAWEKGLRITETHLPDMPERLADILKNGAHDESANSSEHIYNERIPLSGNGDCIEGQHSVNILPESTKSTQVNKVNITFEKGGRDEALFHLAHHLVKSGMPEINARKYLDFFGANCDPPFPKQEISAKIQSALDRDKHHSKGLTQEIREIIESTSGNFSSTFVYVSSTKSTLPSDKRKISAVLCRFIEEGLIERVGSQNGIFRRIDNEVEAMDFINAETETVRLWLPFDLHERAEIMHGNIIVVAGTPNAGKTGFLFNVIRQNMNKFDIHYFNSEMGPSELRKRLSMFDDLSLDMWNFKPWERADNFADVIKPGKGKLNIIDFLEIHDNFYEVGGKLAEIHKKLKGAIAIVALQKNPGLKVGLGGYRGLEKPRLYLSMDSGMIEITKCKNWATSENPNGLQYRFSLVGGCKFIKVQGWHTPVIKT